MSDQSNTKLPNIGASIVQGAYGHRGRQKIEQQEADILEHAYQFEQDPKQNRAKRLCWDNLKRKK